MVRHLNRSDALVVVPAFNEERSVGSVVQSIRAAGLSVVVVNDGSVDGTSNVAAEAGAEVLNLPVNLGVGGALRCGFQYAVKMGYSCAIQIDADGQHDPSEVLKLIDEANATGAQLIVGSRFLSSRTSMSVGVIRRVVMKILASTATLATGTRITDATSGFRLIREPLLSEFARVFPLNYLGDTYEALISAGRAGYSVREVPTAISPREFGESSASVRQAVLFTLKAAVVVLFRIHLPLRRITNPSEGEVG